MDPQLAARCRVVVPRERPQVRWLMRLRPWIRLVRFVQAERAQAGGLPPHKRLRSWWHGFTSRSYALYDLDRNDPRGYVGDALALDYTHLDPHHAALANKLFFSRLMALYGMPHPRVYGILDRGRFRSDDASIASGPLETALEQGLERYRRVVLKPVRSAGGAGVMEIAQDGEGLRCNGVAVTRGELVRLLSPLRHYYASEWIQQAGYASRAFPDATHSLRVLTLWDFDGDEPFIAAAAHHFGPGRPPADPFARGPRGLSAPVELHTGCLGSAVTLDDDGTRRTLAQHPDTGAEIRGVALPHWRETRARLIALANRLPQTPAVGWELIVTERGAVALEASCPPDAAIWQVHGPLLADPRARRCFEIVGLV